MTHYRHSYWIDVHKFTTWEVKTWTMEWTGMWGQENCTIYRGYPAKRALSAMRKHGG